MRKSDRIRVTPGQALRILLPYIWHRLKEQLITVVPVCLYLALFQWLVLRRGIEDIAWILLGILMVIFGLLLLISEAGHLDVPGMGTAFITPVLRVVGGTI
jgi:hypothetical protein